IAWQSQAFDKGNYEHRTWLKNSRAIQADSLDEQVINLPSDGGMARKETGTDLECLVPKPEINARRLNLVIINWNWRDNPSGVSENVGANCLRGQNTRSKRLRPGKKFEVRYACPSLRISMPHC